MKKPVDYRGFSLKKLPEPRFRHMLWLLGWVGYFLLYFLTENLIPWERCRPIHCGLDDLIPFNEWFALFYIGWYVLVFGSLAYTLFFDVEGFKRLQKFIIVTQAVAMFCYILWPSRQDLRPAIMPRDDLLCRAMAFIYAFDTPTGVCPSLHVGYSLGVLSVGLKDRDLKPLWKVLLTLAVVMISLSVCFVKQHSALDVVFALPLGLMAEAVVYRDWWRDRFRGRRLDRG